MKRLLCLALCMFTLNVYAEKQNFHESAEVLKKVLSKTEFDSLVTTGFFSKDTVVGYTRTIFDSGKDDRSYFRLSIRENKYTIDYGIEPCDDTSEANDTIIYINGTGIKAIDGCSLLGKDSYANYIMVLTNKGNDFITEQFKKYKLVTFEHAGRYTVFSSDGFEQAHKKYSAPAL